MSKKPIFRDINSLDFSLKKKKTLDIFYKNYAMEDPDIPIKEHKLKSSLVSPDPITCNVLSYNPCNLT